MRLMQSGQKIACAKKNCNFFVLDLVLSNQAMQTSLKVKAAQERKKPTHLISQKK